ncbi:hypothetical protein DFH07DRAFT_772953 [Mycena maculata]|uniref:Uncharacterized protein n=1 Tax=Mycena maculata TaxID=230809 RepID=A0AAD7J520_9AGAR|nr:hypothetical protein DFH07DRAFT_772953 [Mycena maculata]
MLEPKSVKGSKKEAKRKQKGGKKEAKKGNCHLGLTRLLAFDPAFMNADLIAVTGAYEAMNAQERLVYQDSRHHMLIDMRIPARECSSKGNLLSWAGQKRSKQRNMRTRISCATEWVKIKPDLEKAICNNLIALGWSEELVDNEDSQFPLNYLLHRHHFHDPLTDAEWLTMKPSLEKTMIPRWEEAAGTHPAGFDQFTGEI